MKDHSQLQVNFLNFGESFDRHCDFLTLLTSLIEGPLPEKCFRNHYHFLGYDITVC